MVLTDEKSKFVKSTFVIFSRPLNISLQVVNGVSQNNLIVLLSVINSCFLSIVPVISSFSLICILFGKFV